MSPSIAYPNPTSPHAPALANLLTSFNTWDFDLTSSLLSDDFQHRFYPRSMAHPDKGYMTKGEWLTHFRKLQSLVKSFGMVTPTNVVEGKDVIGACLRAEGKLVSGEAYNMEYHYTVRFDSSGKIRRIDEFIDTAAAFELLSPTNVKPTSTPRRILVCGSTGKQGSAVVQALVDLNKASPGKYQILALSRSPSSPAATALASLPNVTIIQGDLSDIPAIIQSATADGPIHGVFSVLPPLVDPTASPDEARAREETAGKELADWAKKLGAYLVYSGTDFFDMEDTGLWIFETKRSIEKHIHSIPELSFTILRPAYFTDNFTTDHVAPTPLFTHRFTDPSRTIQLISCKDIGIFAAKAFDDSETWAGRTISLAGDEITSDQMLMEWKEVIGEDYRLGQQAAVDGFLQAVPAIGQMFKLFQSQGYRIDIPAVRKLHPELQTWRAFLEEQKGKL